MIKKFNGSLLSTNIKPTLRTSFHSFTKKNSQNPQNSTAESLQLMIKAYNYTILKFRIKNYICTTPLVHGADAPLPLYVLHSENTPC